jgi:transposase
MNKGSEKRQSAMWAESELPHDATESVPEPPAPKGPPRFQAVNRQQMVWRSVDVERLVEPEHVVRAIWELVGRLDLTAFAAEVRAVEGRAGRTPYDPHLLISLWIFAYSQGISSAREVERRCAYHPAYQWLTGCEIVNYHTLSDFRVDHRKALDKLFAQLLAVLSSEGLITLEQVVHDGTKVKAAASGQSFHREKTLRASDGRSAARRSQPRRGAGARAGGARESGEVGAGVGRTEESTSRSRGAGGGVGTAGE